MIYGQSKVPGTVIAYSPASSGLYIGSPSIVVLANGHYLASHDFFGPKSTEHTSAVSRIYRSKNKGKTWEMISEINGQFWSKLFVHQSHLYLMGTHKHHGNAIIRQSMDEGETWTNISTNKGLPGGIWGISGVTVSPVNSDIIWALIENEKGGVYKSTDAGKTWNTFPLPVGAGSVTSIAISSTDENKIWITICIAKLSKS